MDSRAEQYYPTYSFKPEHRDIVLLEFEEAQKIANGQTKVYGQVTNILLAVITILIPLFFNQDNPTGLTIAIKSNALFFSIIIFAFGALLLRYFVDLQRQITINARKVVTLRTLLGLDYGSIHLTLPNWRVEGATNPFAIKYFNGWLNFQSMPFWVLTIGVNAIWWLTTNNREAYRLSLFCNYSISISWLWGHLFITISYLYIFRRNLNDTHETNYLNIVKLVATIFRLKFVDNFEYIIYRAKLAVVEMDRLKVDYESLKKILVEIEDKSFYKNYGFSIKALLRATLSQLPFAKKKMKLLESGGSTITMQLARTLFIPSNQNKYFRKIFEILLSIWLTRKFTKDEILKLYIVSVRYDKGVLGLSKAIKHFFGNLKSKKLSPEECLFLVERLSNATGTVRQERVEYLQNRTSLAIEQDKLNNIYKTQERQGKVKK